MVASSKRTKRTTDGWRGTVQRRDCRDYRTSLRSRCSGWVQRPHGAPSTAQKHSSWESSPGNTPPASSECSVLSLIDLSSLVTSSALQAQQWTQSRNAKFGKQIKICPPTSLTYIWFAKCWQVEFFIKQV